MSEKIYYTIINKGYKSLSELDFELYKEVLGDIDYDMAWPESIGNGYRVDGEPIRIDALIELLQKAKNEGANYVCIETHGDHHGYEIETLDIHESTENEINQHLEEKEKRNKRTKQKEYNKLVEELEKLKKEL